MDYRELVGALSSLRPYPHDHINQALLQPITYVPSSLLSCNPNPTISSRSSNNCMRARTQAKPLAARFNEPASNELMRIIPMTLRITHYSRAHALWPGRPKIHFDGEMHIGVSEANPSDSGLRLVQGTVQMAASGDVRWSHVRPSYQFPPPSLLEFEYIERGGRGCSG
jgi:hypothetical protein